jgi:hypothetical protein
MEMLQKSNRIRKGKYSFSINVLYWIFIFVCTSVFNT